MGTSIWQDRRIWLGGGGLLAVVMIAASWFLIIHPKLAGADDLRSQAANTASQNAVLVAKNNALAAQQKHIAQSRADLAKQLRNLPSNNALTPFIDKLTTTAADESVTITNTTVSAPAPVAAAVAPAATTTTDGTGASASASPTPSPTTSSTADATATAPAVASQYSIAITVATTGTVPHQIAFLHALQHGARPLLITSTQVTAAANATHQTTLTTQFAIFTAPMSAAEVAQLTQLLHGAK